MTLLHDIGRCEAVRQCINNKDVSHPCFKIVNSQSVKGVHQFQVPEPWSGNLDRAKILFISSNPSIGDDRHYPTSESTDEYLADYFINRFRGGSKDWIRDGTKGLKDDGSYENIKFWSGVKARARELLGSKVQPGIDYALTEVVHCKSKRELGVSEALDYCADKYLKKILDMSSARVVVALGVNSKKSLVNTFDLKMDERLIGPVTLMGRERLVVFLPHPNARKIRTFKKIFEQQQLDDIRKYLNL